MAIVFPKTGKTTMDKVSPGGIPARPVNTARDAVRNQAMSDVATALDRVTSRA